MAEDSFKNYLFAFILISVFGMLILTAVISVGSDYGMDTSEVFAGSLSVNKFNESITNVESNAKSLKESFDKQSIWSALAGIVVDGIFGIAKDMFTMILLPYDIILDLMIDIFGVPVWVTSVLLGLLILGAIFGVWRLLKIGD
jgi:hypothetical protein